MFECAGLCVHMPVFANLCLPQCVCMCVFVSMLLLCMMTQFQGCGWAKGCPWLSLLIIWWSLRQLSRGQRVSSEETEGALVLNDRLWHIRTPVVFMGSVALKWYIKRRRMLHIYTTRWHLHTHTNTCADLPADVEILKYMNCAALVYIHANA